MWWQLVWLNQLGLKIQAHISQPKLWNLCSFFSFGNCNKLPNNGNLGMVIIKTQTHCKKRFGYTQFKKNPRIDIYILCTKLCHLANIHLHPFSSYFWNMSLFTIAKKDSNMSSFKFFIYINWKVSDGSSRYETILEKLRG